MATCPALQEFQEARCRKSVDGYYLNVLLPTIGSMPVLKLTQQLSHARRRDCRKDEG